MAGALEYIKKNLLQDELPTRDDSLTPQTVKYLDVLSNSETWMLERRSPARRQACLKQIAAPLHVDWTVLDKLDTVWGSALENYLVLQR